MKGKSFITLLQDMTGEEASSIIILSGCGWVAMASRMDIKLQLI